MEAEAPDLHRLLLEIDDADHPGVLGGHVEQLADLLLRQDHRQQPALERVVAEDVREGGGDHGPDALVVERPDGVLARRSAGEVAPRDEQGPAPVLGPVEDEGRSLRPAFVVAPVVEEEGAVAGPLDPLQELLGNDLIGVDVGAVERDDHSVLGVERPHWCSSWNRSSRRTSTKWPAAPAAAALAGETA